MLVTFLGWEGVGTCSYLLISFWHERETAATAGKKAFVTNRVGDWGFMMAMFFAFQATGTLSYIGVNGAAHTMAQTTSTAIALFCFIGACGKSAQLPLYMWLPDAMEGPTPVSALIHAATMVTAGVFLMCRMSPILEAASSYAPTLIAIVGVATALFAATIAVAQNDIKKVLAYSTISQLGYMFLAVGSGAYTAAIFHMVTHAFFKALLFLGSGAVIHGMHHEQDMRRMGALRKVMPITAATFIVGWLAIAGVPPFAGFWSKDDILLAAYDKSPVLWVLGLVTALLTAYYMTRQVIMVFYGEARWHDAHEEHGAHGDFKPHESPAIMLLPLVVLAGLSIVGGGLNLPFNAHTEKLTHWLEPVLEVHHSTTAKLPLAAVATVVALVGIAASIMVYAKHKAKVVEPAVLAEGWYVDSTVSRFMGGPGREAFDAVAWYDATIIDGAVNGVGRLVRGTAQRIRTVQSGNVRNYAAAIGVGVVLLLGWFVVVRGNL
jgi:NADH-quinone oxidoreductase subunit L